MAMVLTSFRSLLLISAIFRLVLIFYGEWQDKHMEVRYTDVDYLVFSDAASLMTAGKSPYKRITYRYSPLLAFILIPNSFLHHSLGKFLFSASDLLVGILIRVILKKRNVPETLCNYSVITWLANPFTFTIGTRGNCEPLICAIILWVIFCIMNGKLLQAAIWYGFVVHFRIYPIIYALPIVLALDPLACSPNSVSNWKPETTHCHVIPLGWDNIFTRGRILFGLVSASVFAFFTMVFYYIYGWEFLNEALIYHLTRTDPRHNFSIYFYHIYLHSTREFSVLEKMVSFLPQLIVQLALVLRFAHDLPFCFFVQTVAFVAFNKVMTAQYFVWFFCLVPLVLPWSNIKMKWKGIMYMALWIGAQLHWLLWAYLLEFGGKNVFIQLWIASLIFFAANCFMIIEFIRNHRYVPLFQNFDSKSVKIN